MSEWTVSGSVGKQAPATNWPRFSLRSLLLLTAAVSLFFAQVPWFGDAYVYAMVFSFGVIFLMWKVMFRFGHGLAMLLSLPIAVVGLLSVFGSLAFCFHTLCNILAGILCLYFLPKPKMALAVLSTGMVIPYACLMYDGLAELREYDRFRLAYPLIPLEQRIAVLGTTSGPDSRKSSSEQKQKVVLAPAVKERLDDQAAYSANHFSRHSMALRLLHDETERQFIAAQGFGISRMPSHFSPRYVELEEASTVALPLAVDLDDASHPDRMHAGIVSDFIDPERTGYVRNLQEVAGFEAHAITGLKGAISNNKPFTAWKLTQLQLVSLLRHEEPVVYESETLPQMETITEYPHRPLNTFEVESLPKLHAQQDVVVKKEKVRITMLGAIRADKTCLACHSGQRGDLLGAFSYVLMKSTTSVAAQEHEKVAELSTDNKP